MQEDTSISIQSIQHQCLNLQIHGKAYSIAGYDAEEYLLKSIGVHQAVPMHKEKMIDLPT
jgi:hypothetical protein